MTIETILVLNAGSSSIKFQLFKGEESVLSGQIDGLGASAWVKGKSAEGKTIMDRALSTEEARTTTPRYRSFLHCSKSSILNSKWTQSVTVLCMAPPSTRHLYW